MPKKFLLQNTKGEKFFLFFILLGNRIWHSPAIYQVNDSPNGFLYCQNENEDPTYPNFKLKTNFKHFVKTIKPIVCRVKVNNFG